VKREKKNNFSLSLSIYRFPLSVYHPILCSTFV
jgi:hypothetical protein